LDVFALTATLSLQADNFFSGLADAAEAMARFAADSVRVGAGFDASMSKVSAISGATADEFELLRELAREAGATTQYTAQDAADALTYMAMAGWKTDQMMAGLSGILDLAAASGEDLARTSDIVTDALTAFGMTAEESGHFANILAAASSNSNTNVSMMGETFKYAASIAGALGYSAEDTAFAIGLMANSGIKASQAGTTLRRIMTALTGDVKVHGEAYKDYIDGAKTILTSEDGEMTDFRVTIAELRDAFSKLTDAEKASEAESLVGKYAMSGFLALMNASEEDWIKLANAIDNCNGAAERMADTMMNNLSGSMKEWNSAVQDFQIALSDKLTPTIREFVDFGTKGMRDFTEAFEKDGLDGAIEVFGKFVEDGSAMIQEKLPVFQEKGTKILNAISKGIHDASPTIKLVIDTLGTMVGDFLNENTDTIITTVTTLVKASSSGVSALLRGIFGGLTKSLPDIWDDISGSFQDFIQNFLWLVEDKMPLLANVLESLLGVESKAAHDARVAQEAELKAAEEAAKNFVENTNSLEPAQLVATFDDQASEPIQYAREIFDDFLAYNNSEAGIASAFTDNSTTPINLALEYINDILAYNGTNVETLSTFVDESSDPALQAIVRLQELSDMSQKDYKSFSEHSSEVPGLVQTILEWLQKLEGEQGEISHTSSVHDVITRYITETDGSSTANTYAENQSKTNAEKKIEKLGGSGNYAIHARSMYEGTILRGATMFGWDAQGRPQIGGGEGPEAVVGVNSLNEQIRGAVRDGLSGIVGAIAQAVGGRNEQPVYVVLDTGELVGAIGGKMDAEFGEMSTWRGGGRA
jgi:TP901 family phage tail tape measure protein